VSVTRTRLLWLSGRSDPSSVALSPAQRSLLQGCQDTYPDLDVVPCNFPYRGDSSWRGVPLPLAALRNGAQFLAAAWPAQRRQAEVVWRTVCSDARRVLVLTGSCGAELLRTVEGATPPDVAVSALALGPVAWRAPQSLSLAVVGDRDRIAAAFVRRWRVPYLTEVAGVGHMDYLETAEVRRIVVRWIGEQGASG